MNVLKHLPTTTSNILPTHVPHFLCADIAKNILNYVAAEVEILVAPCPSINLALIMGHRGSMGGVRAQLETLAGLLFARHGNGERERVLSISGGSIEDSRRGAPKSELRNTAYKTVWTARDVHETLTLGRILSEMIEEIIAESQPFIQLMQQYQAQRRTSLTGAFISDSIAGTNRYLPQYQKRNLTLLTQLYRSASCLTPVINLFLSLCEINS
jgi:hypothetical protein